MPIGAWTTDGGAVTCKGDRPVIVAGASLPCRPNRSQHVMSVAAGMVKAAQRGVSVNEVGGMLLALIKDLKIGRDSVYQWLGCVAGILMIVASTRDQRPNEVLSGVFRGIGAHSIGEWFETSLPPVLTQPNSSANHLFIGIAFLAVVSMLAMPFFSARKNEWHLDFQAAGLLGARAPSTAWISLMFAAQFGSLQWAYGWLYSLSWVLGAVIVVLAVILLVTYLAICKLQIQDLFVPVVGTLLRCGAQAGVVVTATAFALILVVAGPLLGFALWLFSTVSEAHYEAQCRIAQKRSERKVASGAKPIRRTA